MVLAIFLRAVIAVTLAIGIVGLIFGQLPMPKGVTIKGMAARTLGLFLLLPAFCNWVAWSIMSTSGPLPRQDWGTVDLSVAIFTGIALLIAAGGAKSRYEFVKRNYASPDLITIQEASHITLIPEQELGKLVASGAMPSVYFKGKYRIDRRALSTYMAAPGDFQTAMMSVREASEHFLIPEKELSKLIVAGKIGSTLVAGQYRVSADAVKAYLDATLT
jgi:hypothetical protein